MTNLPGSVSRADELNDSQLAAEIKRLLAAGEGAVARRQFAELVTRHQRRASWLAYQYLRNVAEVDEAVQDAFVKIFANIGSYREELPFQVWFTRILVNGCLDRVRSRARRSRWLVGFGDTELGDAAVLERTPAVQDSPEDALLSGERRVRLHAALAKLPPRQRDVVLLCHFDEHSTREVSQMLGLSESTVRVHLFRALRRLRTLLSASAMGASDGRAKYRWTRT